MAYSHAYSYTYESKKTGQPTTSHKLECRVVGKSEKDYVLAVLKGTPSEVESAKTKYVNGSVWELSKVKLEDNITPAHITAATHGGHSRSRDPNFWSEEKSKECLWFAASGAMNSRGC